MIKILKFLLIFLLIPNLCFGAASRDFAGGAGTDVVSYGSGSAIDDTFANGGTETMWIKNDAFEITLRRLHDKDNGANSGWFNGIFLSGNTRRVQFTHGFSIARGVWLFDDRISTVGNWDHFVLTYSRASTNNDPSIYVNRINYSISSEFETPSGTGNSDAADNLLIGNRASGGRSFNGKICYASLYNRIITAVEVNEIYFKPEFIPDSRQHLTPLWADSTEIDLSGGGNTGTVTNTTASSDGPPVMFGGGLPL